MRRALSPGGRKSPPRLSLTRYGIFFFIKVFSPFGLNVSKQERTKLAKILVFPFLEWKRGKDYHAKGILKPSAGIQTNSSRLSRTVLSVPTGCRKFLQ